MFDMEWFIVFWEASLEETLDEEYNFIQLFDFRELDVRALAYCDFTIFPMSTEYGD